jgi:16S rRNA G527 N7-methylase RsmG
VSGEKVPVLELEQKKVGFLRQWARKLGLSGK